MDPTPDHFGDVLVLGNRLEEGATRPDPTWPASPTPDAASPSRILLDPAALDPLREWSREKESRTAAEARLSSALIRVARSGEGEGDLPVDEEARVRVEVTARVTEDLLKHIEAGGGVVVYSYPEYDSIQAWVPPDRLTALAGREEVRFVQPFYRPLSNAGPTTWEGDVTHRAAEARATFNVTGSGVKVGVLSDSVDHLGASQAAGELGQVHVLPGQEGEGSGEGTAMLEIVHDLAPTRCWRCITATRWIGWW